MTNSRTATPRPAARLTRAASCTTHPAATSMRSITTRARASGVRYASSSADTGQIMIELVSSVAEDGGVVSGPFPHRRRAGDLRSLELLRVLEVTCIQADRAEPELAAAVSELREQALERWASLAHDALHLAREPEPHGVLRRPDDDLLALLQRRGGDEERDQDALAVLHAGREVDQNLVGHFGLPSLRAFMGAPRRCAGQYPGRRARPGGSRAAARGACRGPGRRGRRRGPAKRAPRRRGRPRRRARISPRDPRRRRRPWSRTPPSARGRRRGAGTRPGACPAQAFA